MIKSIHRRSLPGVLSSRNPFAGGVTSVLLVVCLWLMPAVLTVNAASSGTVVAWGWNNFGQTTVPTDLSDVTAIAAGSSHTVALKSDGTVVAWGYNGDGEMNVPAGLSGVVAIAAGVYHIVALKSDGTVVAWGNNDTGKTNVPAGLSGVTAIAAGNFHTAALKSDGTVVAWGGNGNGQTNVPAGLSGVTAIAAGYNDTVALKSDGTVVAWGKNLYGQSVPAGLNGVVAIAAGASHTVALKNNGTVVAWGGNGHGETTVPAGLSGVTAIAAGASHTVALKNNGTVVAWGGNGHGETTVPAGLSGVMAIAAGGQHTVALVTTGDIVLSIAAPPASQTVNVGQSASFTVTATGIAPLYYQWRKEGSDLSGATNATYSLTDVQTNQAGSYTVVVSNTAGSVTSAPPAVLTVNADSAGTVVAWGFNYFGQTTVPGGLSGVMAIAAGGDHTVALKSNGTVVAWGIYYPYDQTTVPDGLNGVTAIAAGNSHTVALKSNGTVVAWGYNYSGQTTGTPTTNYPSSATANPVTLNGQTLNGVTAVAAGVSHTVVLKNDGTLVAWGDNSDGQMIAPAGLSGVTAIAAGFWHTVALKNDGTVVAWGYNGEGQTTLPAGLSGVTAIASGGYHTVALKSDGTVVAWGRSNFGETNVPAGLSGVAAIAAGSYHTVALKNNGTVVAWGAGTINTGFFPHQGQSIVPAGLSGVTAIVGGGYHTVALVGGAGGGDGAPPVIVISAPTAEQTFTTSPIIVSGTAGDPGSPSSGVNLVEVRVNGSAWQSATLSLPNWNRSLALNPGSNAIEARSRDAAGNYSPVASVTVTYTPSDVTPPAIAVSSPTARQAFTGSPITVSGTASDPGSPSSGVNIVEVRVNGGAWQSATLSLPNWSRSMSLSSGNNTIEARSRDAAGNYSANASVVATYNPSIPPPRVDLVVKRVQWDTARGGLKVTYSSGPIFPSTSLVLFWANGDSLADTIGSPVYSTSIPVRTAMTSVIRIVQVEAAALVNPPPDATHLIAIIDPEHLVVENQELNNEAAVADVQITYSNPDRDERHVSTKSQRIIKNLLRQAGHANGVITSTYRSAADQARVMFENLVNGTSARYGTYGQMVIDVYRINVVGHTRTWIRNHSEEIITAMTAKISEIGPENVSHHSYDPAVLNVIDIGPVTSRFTFSAKQRFSCAVLDGVENGSISSLLWTAERPHLQTAGQRPGPSISRSFRNRQRSGAEVGFHNRQ